MTKRVSERTVRIPELDIASRTIGGVSYTGRLIQFTAPQITVVGMSVDIATATVNIAAEFTVGSANVAQSFALFRTGDDVPDGLSHVHSARSQSGEWWHLYRRP